jgi:hypothetical protein
MNGTISAAVLGGMILVMGLGVPVWARSDADEAQLESIRKDIDKTIPPGQTAQVQTLAKQYGIPPGVVQDLRAKKQGWGETSIELAMAQRLARVDAKTYPTMTDALNKIETLRGQKVGWGKIARSLGFKLGPVVSNAMHTRNELRRDFHAHESAPVQKATSAGKPDKPAMGGKAERPEFIGRPERPARPEKAARAR